MTFDAKAITRTYYGETLTGSADLQSDACCTPDDVPAWLRPVLAGVHPDVSARYYGCGLVAPLKLEGARILDLGCGAGRDVYALSKLAGPDGLVVGVDMTPEQLDVARAHQDWHAERYGHPRSNVQFIEGDIEALGDLDLPEAGFDVIVSNCVINLVDDKAGVLKAARRLLAPGGEMYFSDVYADRRLPRAMREDPLAHGECLGGALYWNDFLTLAKAAGFHDPRLVTSRPLAVLNPALETLLAPARFHSATYRLFALDRLEPACEDYGQAVIYRGGIAGAERVFMLDQHHVIEGGKVFPVCGNTFDMLKDTRFAAHFEFIGDRCVHYGIFPGCGLTSPFETGGAPDQPMPCC
jgi:arsenite methyltransferase